MADEDELAGRKQFEYLVNVYGWDHAAIAWNQASREHDEQHHDAELWRTSADFYELTDDDVDYIFQQAVEDDWIEEDDQ